MLASGGSVTSAIVVLMLAYGDRSGTATSGAGSRRCGRPPQCRYRGGHRCWPETLSHIDLMSLAAGGGSAAGGAGEGVGDLP